MHPLRPLGAVTWSVPLGQSLGKLPGFPRPASFCALYEAGTSCLIPPVVAPLVSFGALCHRARGTCLPVTVSCVGYQKQERGVIVSWAEQRLG